MISIKDVAKDAGVAAATVSLILNKKERCWASKKTIERVFESARKLNYSPNRSAQSLRTRKFKTFGLIVPDLLNPYFASMAQLFAVEVKRFGYDLIIEDNHGSLKEEELSLKKILSRQVDGAFCFPIHASSHSFFLTSQTARKFPVVFLGSNHESMAADSVGIDFQPGLSEAIAHLAKLGHSRIGFAGGTSEKESGDGRMELFKKEMKTHGLAFTDSNFIRCGLTLESAHQILGEFFNTTSPHERPTALVALNDLVALGVARAALDLNWTLPRDLSIVGMDDIFISRYLPLRLTALSHPISQMVAQAVQFLLLREEHQSEPYKRKLFGTQLIVRESTAAPGAV